MPIAPNIMSKASWMEFQQVYRTTVVTYESGELRAQLLTSTFTI